MDCNCSLWTVLIEFSIVFSLELIVECVWRIFSQETGCFWQPKSHKKADSDLGRPQIFFLLRVFLSLKVHRQTITVFVSFTLVKIESFGWLNWQKHLLLSVVTVFLLWTYNVFLFIHKNWIEFYLNCSFI